MEKALGWKITLLVEKKRGMSGHSRLRANLHPFRDRLPDSRMRALRLTAAACTSSVAVGGWRQIVLVRRIDKVEITKR